MLFYKAATKKYDGMIYFCLRVVFNKSFQFMSQSNSAEKFIKTPNHYCVILHYSSLALKMLMFFKCLIYFYFVNCHERQILENFILTELSEQLILSHSK